MDFGLLVRGLLGGLGFSFGCECRVSCGFRCGVRVVRIYIKPRYLLGVISSF